MGSYYLVVYSAAGLGLAILVLQVQWSEPLINLAISAIGTIFFGIFLAIYVDKIRFRGSKSFGNLVIGILTGFVLDTAKHGIFGTYDLTWQSDFPALLITVASTSTAVTVAGLVLYGIATPVLLPMLMLLIMDDPEVGSENMGLAGGIFFSVAEIAC